MDHELAFEAISAALDGELSEAERAALDAHLAVCPRCRELAEELGILSAALHAEEEVPAGLPDRVNAALDASEGRGKKKILWKRYAGLAAALVLVIGLGALALDGSFLPRAGSMDMSNGSSAPNMEAVGDCEPDSDDFDANSSSGITGDGAEDEAPDGAAGNDQFGGEPQNGEPEHYVIYKQAAFRVTYGYTPDAPFALVIGSTEELKDLLAKFPMDDLESLTGQYGEEFFAKMRLVAVVVEASSGSMQFSVDGLTRYAVQISGKMPGGTATCDMAAWLLLAEVDHFFTGGETLQVQMAV